MVICSGLKNDQWSFIYFLNFCLFYFLLDDPFTIKQKKEKKLLSQLYLSLLVTVSLSLRVFPSSSPSLSLSKSLNPRSICVSVFLSSKLSVNLKFHFSFFQANFLPLKLVVQPLISSLLSGQKGRSRTIEERERVENQRDRNAQPFLEPPTQLSLRLTHGRFFLPTCH